MTSGMAPACIRHSARAATQPMTPRPLAKMKETRRASTWRSCGAPPWLRHVFPPFFERPTTPRPDKEKSALAGSSS